MCRALADPRVGSVATEVLMRIIGLCNIPKPELGNGIHDDAGCALKESGSSPFLFEVGMIKELWSNL